MEGRHVKEVCYSSPFFPPYHLQMNLMQHELCDVGGRPTESEGQESVEEAFQRERSIGDHEGCPWPITLINLSFKPNPYVLAIIQVADANDPVALRKRGTLNLPAPQVCVCAGGVYKKPLSYILMGLLTLPLHLWPLNINLGDRCRVGRHRQGGDVFDASTHYGSTHRRSSRYCTPQGNIYVINGHF